ncbi:TetR/AcrR family transcriptional regulator [Fructobacillus sp. M158]|uniref:TetR/AcrR family transcriptional regulator n=1 Tax=Fructobacillus parabroussonetiae TaxID=2713174 RepID=UPI00200B4A76|nr:TetR/AcrR family transcriptional regulator [Fructobacillus parabroussonetiae]MCK8617873.1 TetR/AcrR family transcriptional regulator [Fructobacillus parabroussonetiae]
MPKAMFDHLKEEKKQQIVQALFEVFKNNNLLTVSVKEIVEAAQIPRGSFYTYFENQADAYDYVLEIVLKRVHESMRAKNPFQATKAFIETIHENPDREFLRHYYVINEAILEASKEEMPQQQTAELTDKEWLASVAVHYLIREFFLNPADKPKILARLSALEDFL